MVLSGKRTERVTMKRNGGNVRRDILYQIKTNENLKHITTI